MKCPACNKVIEFSPKETDEDVYFDCSHCDSSLCWMNGEWRILNKTKSLTKQQTAINPSNTKQVEQQQSPKQKTDDSIVYNQTQSEDDFLLTTDD